MAVCGWRWNVSARHPQFVVEALRKVRCGARSDAYRWGEDRLAGISNHKQDLCFALALWNGKDPIVKDSLVHKYLYNDLQAAYPYADLVETNKRRDRHELEYELLDTGVFNDDRYFDSVSR